jgi:hypothetical protein
VINVPAAVRQLPFQDVAETTLLHLNINFPAPVHEQNEVRAKRAIDQKLAAPMTVRLLLPQQIFLGAFDRVENLRIAPRVGIGQIRSRAG